MSEPSRWARAGLARRTLTIVVGAPLLIGILWLGRWPLAAVVLMLTVLAVRELWRLAVAADLHPSPALVAGAVILPLLAATGRWNLAWPAAMGVVALAAVLALPSSRRAHALSNAAVDVLGGVYTGGLLAYVILLRAEFGFSALMIVLGVIWANDIAAYFVGVTWGRHKLIPAISPGKSVEGFVGGLLAGVIVGVIASTAVAWSPVRAGVLGLLVSLAAVAGDLWESAIKRSAGVKDSGVMLPGHGGVLDRFDAVLFGVPVGYYLLYWLT
jgi:phosphatidate cytidylyltransferase